MVAVYVWKMTLLICIHLHAFLLETQRQPEKYLLIFYAERAEDMSLLKVILWTCDIYHYDFNFNVKKKPLHFNVKKDLQFKIKL